MGSPMEGFFDGTDIVAEAMVSSSAIVAQRALAETRVPPFEPILIEASSQAKKTVNGESAPDPVEIPTPQKGVTPTGVSQTESTSPTTPLAIFASDPFISLSQVVKDSSSLVVIPSSISSSAT